MTDIIATAFLLILVVPGMTEAYIDPGSASFFLQGLLAAILGGLFAIKTYWRRIVKWFRKGNDAGSAAE